jgi:hypothetical protein
MKSGFKAWIAILVTLAVGIVIGMLLNGAMNNRRRDEMQRMRGPGGFVAEMERIIEPRDAAQREAIRPFLAATDNRNRAIVDGARSSMRSGLDSLLVRLSPILDEGQKKRLRDFVERGPRRPPPGLDGDRRPPPPGE